MMSRSIPCLRRLFANGVGLFHVGRKDLAVHAEAIEDRFGFIYQRHGGRDLEKLGEVGFAKLMDKVELAVGEEAGPADAAENIAGAALDAAAVLDRTFSLQRGFAFFDEQYLERGCSHR
jgi:hypothetical protein